MRSTSASLPLSSGTGLSLVAALAAGCLLLLGGCGEGGTPAAALPVAGQPLPPDCRGKNDGVVDPGELDFSAGRSAPYAVQAAGSAQPLRSGDASQGDAVWDFRPLTFERVAELPLLDPAGAWYASVSPEANLAMPVSVDEPEGERTLLLLQGSDTGLTVLGAASEASDQLLLLYDRAVPMMRFPLRPGMSWSAEVRPLPGSVWEAVDVDELGLVDRYDFELRGSGSLVLPGLRLDRVLELRMVLERSVHGQPPLRLEETFLIHECLGTVARHSEPDGAWWVIWYPM